MLPVKIRKIISVAKLRVAQFLSKIREVISLPELGLTSPLWKLGIPMSKQKLLQNRKYRTLGCPPLRSLRKFKILMHFNQLCFRQPILDRCEAFISKIAKIGLFTYLLWDQFLQNWVWATLDLWDYSSKFFSFHHCSFHYIWQQLVSQT